jgi:hypothetical protein
MTRRSPSERLYAKPLRELEKLRFRTRCPLTNYWGTIPPGTEVRVTDKRGGLRILAEPCSCCGVQMRMSHVPMSDLELIE